MTLGGGFQTSEKAWRWYIWGQEPRYRKSWHTVGKGQSERRQGAPIFTNILLMDGPSTLNRTYFYRSWFQVFWVGQWRHMISNYIYSGFIFCFGFIYSMRCFGAAVRQKKRIFVNLGMEYRTDVVIKFTTHWHCIKSCVENIIHRLSRIQYYVILEVGGSTKREKATTTTSINNSTRIIDINVRDEPTYEDLKWMEQDDDDEEEG